MLEKFNILVEWVRRRGQPAPPKENLSELFQFKYDQFKELLNSNAELAKIITDIETKLEGNLIFGMSYVKSQSSRAIFHALRMVQSLNSLADSKYPSLFAVLEGMNIKIKEELEKRKESPVTEWILPYSQITKETIDWVGGKNANLGEMRNRINLPIPEGFVITTKAYEFFMAANDLTDEIEKRKMELDPDNLETVPMVSEEIQRLIISAPVPAELRDAIFSAYDAMILKIGEQNALNSSGHISMRSSAIGEDGDHSFAGQYLSVLNVPREKIIDTYRYIVASLYTPRAISYRLNKGIRDEDIAMSVACLQMINSAASGVIYSQDPFNRLENTVIISAVWGLGLYAVDGTVTPDTYKVGREGSFPVLDQKIAHKPVQLTSIPDGGLTEIPVPATHQDYPCLNPEQISLLASFALKSETHYGYPQDIEWALDKEEKIFLLQTRPLRLKEDKGRPTMGATPLLPHYPLLVEKGTGACGGVGYGAAYQVHSEEDLLNFPEGAILVAKHSSPTYVIVMQKAQGVITDVGSVTGHMASLVREFGVPTIVDAKIATSVIRTGMEVTVDAYSGRVYQGKVTELLQLQRVKKSPMKNTPVYESLRSVANLVIPLRLIDPRSPNFAPAHCQSLHDIMRLVHELSYVEMFHISDVLSDEKHGAIKLDVPIPLDLYVIDLGGGLNIGSETARKVKVDAILSAPFKALLKGMLHEDLRFQAPRPVDMKGFFSVMSEQMLSNTYTAERFGDRSYAIVSDKYLNFNSRVGYHYSILDAYCDEAINRNYVTFSFKGGAADDVRRNRRVRSIALVLKRLDFTVEVAGDRVDARIKKYELGVIEQKLDQLGRLLQFTRQVDMLMQSEASVEYIANSFLEGNYNLE